MYSTFFLDTSHVYQNLSSFVVSLFTSFHDEMTSDLPLAVLVEGGKVSIRMLTLAYVTSV